MSDSFGLQKFKILSSGEISEIQTVDNLFHEWYFVVNICAIAAFAAALTPRRGRVLSPFVLQKCERGSRNANEREAPTNLLVGVLALSFVFGEVKAFSLLAA